MYRWRKETEFLEIPVYVWMGPCHRLWGVRQLEQASFSFLLGDVVGILVKITSVSCISIIRRYFYWVIRRYENHTKYAYCEWLPD